ncbi:alkaline phosphatase [Desertibacillus haloalkaliphilus]|nr:alkaline phosphatase [Desertibacillus haloalkaliphilus]
MHTIKQESVQNIDQPKNIILMIADGMGVGQMEIARIFEYGREGELFIETLPHTAFMRTYSADHSTTDSAAAGTALATGQKTNNGLIGVSPGGDELLSILKIFKESGKSVGVVSTNTVTDATPAAFVANVDDRWKGQVKIARQLYENNCDIILGGGRKFFTSVEEDEDLLSLFQNNGYDYVQTKGELAKVRPDANTKLLGLFHDSHMNFLGDRAYVESKEPTLVEMTEKAISTASQNEDGFFLMIEGARIDHASHAADFSGIWREVIDFDRAVRSAVKWAHQDQETLVVVVSDHETMGVAATEPIDIESLKKIDVSPQFMAAQLQVDEQTNRFTNESIHAVFLTYANINLTDEEIDLFQSEILERDEGIYPEHKVGWEIGSFIAQHYQGGIIDSDIRKASKTTSGHTSNLVPIFAYGLGANRFNGVLDNTDIPKIILSISRMR